MSIYEETLNQDGVVLIPRLLDQDEMQQLRAGIQQNMEKASPMSRKLELDDGSYFFSDFNNWRRNPDLKAIATNDKLVDLICALTKSENCWFFHDHVIVKEGLSQETPWHQDRPYYIFKGSKNLTIWIPSNDVPRDSSLVFLRGSHKTETINAHKSFVTQKDIDMKDGFTSFDPDTINPDDVIDFDMKSGDALVFYNMTMHGSKLNSQKTVRQSVGLRYLLDGAALTEQYINATPPFDRMGVKVTEDAPVPENMFPKLR